MIDKAKKLLTFAQNPELAIFNELKEANDNLKTLSEKTRKVSIAGAELVTIKGKEGEPGAEPKDERLKKLIEPLIPAPKKGEDYVLTKEDKQEIASKIDVPIVEKIVETIIEKQP